MDLSNEEKKTDQSYLNFKLSNVSLKAFQLINKADCLSISFFSTENQDFNYEIEFKNSRIPGNQSNL